MAFGLIDRLFTSFSLVVAIATSGMIGGLLAIKYIVADTDKAVGCMSAADRIVTICAEA